MDILSITHLLNGLLMIAVPVGLAVVLTRRWQLGWRLWLAGGATFVLSQVGHVPFNLAMSSVLNRTALVNLSPNGRLVFNAAFLGLSAGVFEELFRYGMFRWWLKDARSWRKGVLAGAGHGGAEAIAAGTLALIAFGQLAAVRDVDLATLVPADRLALARQQVAAYWSMPWYDSMLGALERVLTIPTQIALAVLVLQAFARRQWLWVGVAVLYHALLDATAVLALPTVGTYGTEAIVGGFGIVSLVIILGLRRPEPEAETDGEGASGDGEGGSETRPYGSGTFVLKPVEETPERLDDTRYVRG